MILGLLLEQEELPMKLSRHQYLCNIKDYLLGSMTSCRLDISFTQDKLDFNINGFTETKRKDSHRGQG